MKTLLYGTILFFLLSPGVLFRFPSNNHYSVVGIHALLFGIVLHVINRYTTKQEGFGMGMGMGDMFITVALFVFIIILISSIAGGGNPLLLLFAFSR